MKCESRIEFAMEAPGFLMVFTCSKKAGHSERHEYKSEQRQRENATRQPYTIVWYDKPIAHRSFYRVGL